MPEPTQIELLQRIEALLSALLRASLSDRMDTLIPDKHHKFLYEHTGNMPVKELAKKTKFSVGKISGIWQQWEQAGLVVKEGKSYRKLP